MTNISWCGWSLREILSLWCILQLSNSSLQHTCMLNCILLESAELWKQLPWRKRFTHHMIIQCTISWSLFWNLWMKPKVSSSYLRKIHFNRYLGFMIYVPLSVSCQVRFSDCKQPVSFIFQPVSSMAEHFTWRINKDSCSLKWGELKNF